MLGTAHLLVLWHQLLPGDQQYQQWTMQNVRNTAWKKPKVHFNSNTNLCSAPAFKILYVLHVLVASLCSTARRICHDLIHAHPMQHSSKNDPGTAVSLKASPSFQVQHFLGPQQEEQVQCRLHAHFLLTPCSRWEDGTMMFHRPRMPGQIAAGPWF